MPRYTGVYLRGSKWFWYIDYKGTRYYSKGGGFDLAESARRERAKAFASLERDEKIDYTHATVSKYYQGNYRPYLKRKMRYHSFEGADGTFRVHILPVLGNVPLNKLTPHHIEELQYTVEDNVSRSRARTVSSRFRAMLNYAVKHNDMLKSPAKSVDLPAKGEVNRIILTIDEVVKLLDNCTFRDRIVFSSAAYAGLRSGEILGLDWKFVDLDKGIYHVLQQLTEGGNGWEIGSLKTKNAKRDIPINDNFIKELKEWKLQCGSSEYLFPVKYEGNIHRISGGAYNSYHVNKICKQVGIRQISLHDLRHWFGSYLLTKGVPLFTVSRLMGHASIKTTADIYGHLIQGTDREAIESFKWLSVEESVEVESYVGYKLNNK